MATGDSNAQEPTAPPSTLAPIRGALARTLNTGAAARLLREAGEAMGETAFEHLRVSTGLDPEKLGSAGFWKELGACLEAQGWGTLVHERVHPGIGLVRSGAWAESELEGSSEAAGCAFSVGMLSKIFSRVAGAEVSVVEARCRNRGDADCAFAFGSSEAVGRLEERLGGGEDFGAVLERL